MRAARRWQAMSAGMTAQLVTDALLMAIWRRGKPDAWRNVTLAAGCQQFLWYAAVSPR